MKSKTPPHCHTFGSEVMNSHNFQNPSVAVWRCFLSHQENEFAILAKAKADLVDGNPEAFKIMLLALVCGLRRSEIDNLLWRSVDFTRKVIRLESTEYHQLKSEDSAGEIDLDDDTLALFRGYRAKAPTELFVIQSPNRPRNETKARTYRCNATFKQVIDWLRAQPVQTLPVPASLI